MLCLFAGQFCAQSHVLMSFILSFAKTTYLEVKTVLQKIHTNVNILYLIWSLYRFIIE